MKRMMEMNIFYFKYSLKILYISSINKCVVNALYSIVYILGETC